MHMYSSASCTCRLFFCVPPEKQIWILFELVFFSMSHLQQGSHGSSPVLHSAYAVAVVSEHVTLNRQGIASFADSLVSSASSLPFPSPSSWAEEPLHPIPAHFRDQPHELSDWIFTVSLLNFSFWSELEEKDRFGVTWKDGFAGKGTGQQKRWTGYWSLPAAIHRGALLFFSPP